MSARWLFRLVRCLLPAACCLLLSLGADARMTPALLGGGVVTPPAGGAFCDGKTAGTCEDLEGQSTCGDDGSSQANCRLSWTASGTGTITNQATGLAGTYAKNITVGTAGGPNSKTSTYSFTSADNKYAFARLKIGNITISGGTDRTVIALGGCMIRVHYAAPVTFNTETSTNIANAVAGTEYYVWLDNTSGGNCVHKIGTTGTKASASSANTTASTGISTLVFTGWNSSTYGRVDDMTIDNVRIGDSAFGDNGE